MFDDQMQNSGTPKNLPVEPTDIFAGVEKDGGISPMTQTPDALAAGLLKKKTEPASSPYASVENNGMIFQNDSKLSAPTVGKIFLFLAAFLLLGGLFYGGWRFYQSKNVSPVNNVPAVSPVSQQPANQSPVPQTVNNTTSIAASSSPSTSIPAQINNDQILFGQGVDRDKDGLDDVREKQLGTDPLKSDTDGDGLSDGDEVIIYKTNPLVADTDGDGLSDGDEALIWHSNPLNKDTDGDSYLDGEEIRNGYSPIGPGKLFSSSSTASGNTTSTPGGKSTSSSLKK
ncbi:MAG TPA: hypothetical protein VLK22_03845 [Candidatus Udaeobacter sp.]|nr:hypothetical protein [Candidatus Udaeobacter sp.]